MHSGCYSNFTLLLCLVDLPLPRAAALLGVRSSTLVRMHREFGWPAWPYRAVLSGVWETMSRAQIVQHRDEVIGCVTSDMHRLNSMEHFVMWRHTVVVLRMLQSASFEASACLRRHAAAMHASTQLLTMEVGAALRKACDASKEEEADVWPLSTAESFVDFVSNQAEEDVLELGD